MRMYRDGVSNGSYDFDGFTYSHPPEYDGAVFGLRPVDVYPVRTASVGGISFIFDIHEYMHHRPGECGHSGSNNISS
jgi:hypothetical protein